VSPRPQASVVILRSGGRSRIVGVGEAAFGGKVAAIAPGRVTIEFDGEQTVLRLTAGAPLPTRVSFAASDPPSDPTTPARAMERREVERRLGQEVSRILAETTLVPMGEGPQVAGFTLARIPEGTLLTDAGLRPGDVLTRINDIPVDSMATLISLWPRLQSENTIRAVVLRNGQPISLTVTLR